MGRKRKLKTLRKILKDRLKKNNGICPLCGKDDEPLTKHHTLWPKRNWRDHELRDSLTIDICRECHDLLHDRYKETRYTNKKRRWTT